MHEDRISWAIPVLACAIIFVCVMGIAMLIGIQPFSIMMLGLWFLLGCGVGYIVWLLT